MTPTRDIDAMLDAIDEFIERELAPLQEQHQQYFDHRREFARTDVERGGPPARDRDEPLIQHEVACAFGLTEPNHGSDATWLETHAKLDGSDWVINGAKRFNTGMHVARYDMIFARTSGDPGSPKGITAFLVPTDSPGF